MLGKNNKEGIQHQTANKVNRYGIRRLSMGVASVAVAGLLFMSNSVLAAGEQTPVEQTPVEQTPVEQTPVEQTPGEQTPGEQTPGEQTPVEQTPVEQTPEEELSQAWVHTLVGEDISDDVAATITLSSGNEEYEITNTPTSIPKGKYIVKINAPEDYKVSDRTSMHGVELVHDGDEVEVNDPLQLYVHLEETPADEELNQALVHTMVGEDISDDVAATITLSSDNEEYEITNNPTLVPKGKYIVEINAPEGYKVSDLTSIHGVELAHNGDEVEVNDTLQLYVHLEDTPAGEEPEKPVGTNRVEVLTHVDGNLQRDFAEVTLTDKDGNVYTKADFEKMPVGEYTLNVEEKEGYKLTEGQTGSGYPYLLDGATVEVKDQGNVWHQFYVNFTEVKPEKPVGTNRVEVLTHVDGNLQRDFAEVTLTDKDGNVYTKAEFEKIPVGEYTLSVKVPEDYKLTEGQTGSGYPYLLDGAKVEVKDQGNVWHQFYVNFTKVQEENPGEETPAEEYLAVFNGNGGSPATQKVTVKDGEVVSGVTEPTREGYKFVKWVKLGTDNAFDLSTPFSKDLLDDDQSVIFTAVWEKVEDETPLVPVEEIEGSEITNDDQTVKEDEAIEDIVITPGEGSTVTVGELPEGLNHDKETGTISGTPDISDWADDEEERELTIEVTTENPDGSATTDDITITIERDTDGDGVADKIDFDDDNDGYTDEEEKEAGTDPKDAESKPEIADEENEDNKPSDDDDKPSDGDDKPSDDDDKPSDGDDKPSDDDNEPSDDDDKPSDGDDKPSDDDNNPSEDDNASSDDGEDDGEETAKSQAEEIDIQLPAKTGVKDINNLTDIEKETVKIAIADANDFPKGTEILVGLKGDAIINYPDGSHDVIAAEDLVHQLAGSDQAGADSQTPGSTDGSEAGESAGQGSADKEAGKDSAKETDKEAGKTPVATEAKDGKSTSSSAKSSDSDLPETGEADNHLVFGAAALSVLAGLGMVAPRRKEEE